MFDREVLRNQQLIEEREVYENSFISIDDIIKSDERDYYNCPQYDKYISGDFEIEEYELEVKVELDLEFEFKDYFAKLRDEQLIEERLAYERKYFLQICEEDPIEEDALDILAASFEEYHMPDFINPAFFDDYYEDDYYFEEYNMDAAYSGGQLFGYIVDDNESFEEYDYPEGPDENLQGFRYPEPDYFDFQEPDYEMEYYECVDLDENEESNLQMLIHQHIAEEKEFLEFISKEEIPEEYYPPELKSEDICYKLNI